MSFISHSSTQPESQTDVRTSEYINLQKHRTGLQRLWHAGLYSVQGLHAGWHEKAFRLEACLALVLLPAALWVGQSWLEIVTLIACVLLVLVVELLNSAIEATVDRIGLEWHLLAKKAKDLGSAAVLLTLMLCAGTWIAAVMMHWR